MSRNLLFSLLLVFFSFSLIAQNDYYWVGGSGFYDDVAHWASTSGGNDYRSVEPGPTDNVFFDANSGFTAGDNIVTLRATGFTKGIIFNGTRVPIDFVQEGNQSLHIYGSSEWQRNMTIAIAYIHYENTNQSKTIRSNDVRTSNTEGQVYFKEQESISLWDDFTTYRLSQQEGNLNTNGHTVNISYYNANGSSVINLFNSDIFLVGSDVEFSTASSDVVVNAGTSHIHFTEGGILAAYSGQVFYDVSFENPNVESGYNINGSNNQEIGNPVSFNKVEFFGNGIIEGYNVFETLILHSRKTFQLGAGNTQTITSKFDMHTADCSGWSALKSTEEGVVAIISAASDVEIDVNGAIIKDIHSEGGADFTAENSIDQGNNTGWAFTSTAGTDLFWVGEGIDSDWNNAENWASTSGGESGACVPGPNDNVYFDENSGFSEGDNLVALRATGFVKDITFSGTIAPVEFIQENSQVLYIYGSSEWQEGMIVAIDKIHYENTNEPKTIRSNGVRTGINVYFKEQESISLLDAFITGVLIQEAGIWNTNGNEVTLVSFSLYSDLEGLAVNLFNSDIYVREIFDTSSDEVIIDAGTSHIHFIEGGGLAAYSGQSFYDVSFENPDVESGYNIYGSNNQDIDNPVIFNKVEFFGEGKIEGYNEFDILILHGGKNYQFEAWKTQTITTKFEMHTTDCSGWSALKSTEEGVAAIISAASDVEIDVNGAIIKDIHSEGGADFTAENSIDQGNNTGWAFTSTAGTDLFWVGEGIDSDWNNAENWASTSGGESGACVPGPNDNVYFDENSGFSEGDNLVTLRATGFVKDITFNGTIAPVEFTEENSQVLYIYGSSEWQEGMIVAIDKIHFESTNEPKTIRSNGVRTGRNVYFKEQENINLLDNFTSYRLSQQDGTWNTNGHTVNISYYNANGSSVVNLFNSDIFLVDSYVEFSTASAEVVLNAGTSHIHFTQENTEGGGLVPYSGQVYHDISFENPDVESGYNIYGSNNQDIDNPVIFNKVEFFGNGKIEGYNELDTLILHGAKTFQFEAERKQSIEDLQIRGTPCDVVKLRSTQQGQQAEIEVIGEQLAFNFVNI